MDSVLLYEEFRLIERNDTEVSVVWKGAHLILFFLSFVFGSFCTFFFHVLMYMFDQKCVLFPEIVPHSSLRKIVYEFFTINADDEQNVDNFSGNELPVDFMSTQWVEDSVCYMPTYVPLVSGLCGLIWTTMFLMCSSATSSPAGMQRQWRALPFIFVFSVAMSSLCIYASTTTNRGLEALCTKLGRLTGSDSCTYTINVATLGYERRIRGVYQATRLTIATAWLHTSCWLLSALLTLVRLLLAIDFQLVRVKVTLNGDIDRMMEKYERHVRCVSPDSTALTDDRLSFAVDDVQSDLSATSSAPTKTASTTNGDNRKEKEDDKEHDKKHDKKQRKEQDRDVFYVSLAEAIFVSDNVDPPSVVSLVQDEKHKLYKEAKLSEHQFFVKLLFELVEDLELPSSKTELSEHDDEDNRKTLKVHRQQGRANIISSPLGSMEALEMKESDDIDAVDQYVQDFIDTYNYKVIQPTQEDTSSDNIIEVKSEDLGSPKPSTSYLAPKKSSLRTKDIQASSSRKVQISEEVIILKEPESKGKVEDQVEYEEDKDKTNVKHENEEKTQTPKEKKN